MADAHVSPPPPRKALDIVGSKEAAEILGINPRNLLPTPGLPEPVAVLAATKVWDGAEIRAFAREYEQRRRTPISS
jgi:hypothetical protein